MGQLLEASRNLLFICWVAALLFAPLAGAQAASSSALNATLLPAADGAEWQLAVHWDGPVPANLTVALAGAEASGSALVQEWPLQAGANLLPVAGVHELFHAAEEAALELGVRDAAGGMLESGSWTVDTLRGASDFVWESTFYGPGLDAAVHAAVIWDDGSGSALYVGGEFLTAGDQVVNGVARWDGASWQGLSDISGTGVGDAFNARVLAMAVYDGALFVGGEFGSAGGVAASNIARWDGGAWSALGAGTNNVVEALVVFDDELVVGGWFAQAGGLTVNRIARWDGQDWTPLTGSAGTGVDSMVLALTVYQGDLYAGGWFFQAGGIQSRSVARWDGQDWFALSGPSGTGTSGSVEAFAEYEGDLIIGGTFASVGDSLPDSSRVARWDGSDWSALGGGVGSGFSGGVYALGLLDGALIAGGTFEESGGATVNHMVRWNGSQWTPLPFGTGAGVEGGDNSAVNMLVPMDGGLVVGGYFHAAGGFTAGNHLALLSAGGWSALGASPATGVSDNVLAMTVYQGELVIGGTFRTAGDQVVNHVARWNGHGWSPLTGASGTGTDGEVQVVAVHDGDLFVGGDFARAGGTVANSIARWDGQEWSALQGPAGTGVSQPSGVTFSGNARVFSLLTFEGDLLVGGDFVRAGGLVANGIARWDGAAWSPLGTGMSSGGGGVGVFAMAEYNGDLVAGGFFFQAGGTVVNGIARWDGQGWSGMGGGMNDTVYALQEFQGELVAGGAFTQPANYIARWNGSNWATLGSGMSGHLGVVGVLTISAGDLIAGGLFTHAGSHLSNYIAGWDGSDWYALPGSNGVGFGNPVYALAHPDAGTWAGRLVAGGEFRLSGGVPNWRLAVYAPATDLAVEPDRLDFGAVMTGHSAGPRVTMLRNTGGEAVTVDGIAAPAGPFARTGGDCDEPPFVLATAESCTLEYGFSPAVAGDFTEEVVMTSSSGGTATLTLNGTGTGQTLHFAPDTLDFGPVAVGAHGWSSVTLTNAGDVPRQISAVSGPQGPFSLVGESCGLPAFTLEPLDSCTLTYMFSPSGGGVANATVEVSSDAPGSPHVLALAGQGQQRALMMMPSTLDFGTVALGEQAIGSVVLENTGDVALNIDELAGPDTPFEPVGGSCGTVPLSIAAGAGCTLDFSFTPLDASDFEATVTLSGNAPSSPDALTLQGTGTGPIVALSAPALDFGSLMAGNMAEAGVVVTNAGDTDLQIDSFSAPGAPFELVTGEGCSPPEVLAPSAQCEVVIRFAPDQLGSYSDSIGIISNAYTSPDGISLHGVAFDATQLKLMASDGSAFDNFGMSVAVDGDTAAVGATGEGAVYIFTYDQGQWTESAKLTPSDATGFTGFGAALNLSGDGLVVGAPNAAVDGNSSQGAAYVFVFDEDDWVEQQKLVRANGQPFENFGVAIALDGDQMLVGARGVNVNGNFNQGAAYVFGLDDGQWHELAELIASNGGGGDNFGNALALHQGRALISAPSSGIGGGFNQGAVWFFAGRDEDWEQQGHLLAGDGGGGDQFGRSVVLHDDIALIGAEGATLGGTSGVGAVYVFTADGGSWNQTAKLTAADGQGGDNFGRSLALSAESVLIGARNRDIGGHGNQGAAYLFVRDDDQWMQADRLQAVDGGANDQFGEAVALSGYTALVGAPIATVDGQQGRGAAYVFDLAPATPEIVFDPDTMNFGNVPVGLSGGPLATTLRNLGKADATGLDFVLDGDGFDVDTADCGEVLAAGDSCEVLVTFSPQAVGVHAAELEATADQDVGAALAVSGSGVEFVDAIFSDRFQE